MSNEFLGAVGAAAATGLRAVTSEMSTPDERLEAIYRAAFADTSVTTPEGMLLEAALSDAAYLATSAIHYAEKQIPEITDTTQAGLIVRRSFDLLRVAELQNEAWVELKNDWDRGASTRRIPLDVLTHEVTDDGLMVIGYSPKGQRQIDAFPLEAGGCPARGIILEKFYQRFVTVLYDL